MSTHILRKQRDRHRSVVSFFVYDDPEGFIDIGDLVVKSKKKGRRVRTKGNVVNARFDPSAPTTSAVML